MTHDETPHHDVSHEGHEAAVTEHAIPAVKSSTAPVLSSKKLAAAAKHVRQAAMRQKAAIRTSTQNEQREVRAEANRRAAAIQQAGSAKVAAMLAMIAQRRSAISNAFGRARAQIKANSSMQKRVARSDGARALADLRMLINDKKRTARDGAEKEALALEATGRTEGDRARNETATTVTAINDAGPAAMGRAGNIPDVQSAVRMAVNATTSDAIGKTQQQGGDVATKAENDAKDAAKTIRDGGHTLADEVGLTTVDVERSIIDATSTTVQRIIRIEQSNLRQLDRLKHQCLAGLDKLKASVTSPIKSATRAAARQVLRAGQQTSNAVKQVGAARCRAIDQAVRQANGRLAALPTHSGIDDAKLNRAVTAISASFTHIHREGSAAVSAETRNVTTRMGRVHQGLTTRLSRVVSRVASRVGHAVSSARRSTSQAVTMVSEDTTTALNEMHQAHKKTLSDFGKQLQDNIDTANQSWASQRTEHETTIRTDVDHGLRGVIDVRPQIAPKLIEIADTAKAEQEKPWWKKALSGIWEGIKIFVGGLLIFIVAVVIVALIVLVFVSGITIGAALAIAALIVGVVFLVVGFVMALISRWGQLIDRLNAGDYPWYAVLGLGTLTVLAAAGDVVGVTPLVEAIVGHDAVSWQPLSAEERWERGTVGVLTLITLGLARRANLRGKTNTTARLPQDVAVDPVPPQALPSSRSIGRPSHNRALQADIATLPRGATDIRVNQQQVNARRERVGINRPDLQYTLNGKRYYVEYEGVPPLRAAEHKRRILANDPAGVFILRIVP